MLHLHRAEQAGTLVPALAQVLATGEDDPFARRVVAVGARGVERWLAQRLSHHLGAGTDQDGVCANVDMPSPQDLVQQAMEAVRPVEQLDPWHPEALTWQVLARLGTHRDEPWLADVARHLGIDRDGDEETLQLRRGRRFGFAQRTARRYAAYAAQRPAMLTAWRQGLDEDGTGNPLPGHQRWQAELWRRLRQDHGGHDPVLLAEEAARALIADPGRSGLPHDISIFTPSRLDEGDLAVLLALAHGHEVHLFLAHPSPRQWQRLARHPVARTTRAADTSPLLVRNPLLRHLGRTGREFQAQLGRGLAATPVPHRDTHHRAPPRGTHLLARLQEDITTDTDPGGPCEPAPDPSVQFHACHGPARQVEVLRELVTGLLEEDPTLEPRDIIVMCPQLEDFAPRLLAVFGDGAAAGPAPEGAGHPGRHLRIRLAGRSLRRTNPVLDVLTAVLTLAGSRRTLDQMLDLLAMAPVRQRFALDDDQLEQVREWMRQAHVRWGLTARDRTRFGLGDLPENTWHRGLDRLLLGVAMDGDGHRGRLAGYPLDGIDSTAVDLAGRLTEFVHRVAAVLRRTTGAHPAGHWLTVLTDVVDTLTLTRGRNAWQQTAARAVLLDTLDTPGQTTPPLQLADVQALLTDRLADRPTRSSFRTGDLTICSLAPMRSVPHRVVILLGMDAGVFPHGTHPDGDDLLQTDPLAGEHDVAGQERQTFLDALLAARDHFLVLYAGADDRTGAERPPAVPVAELLDVACATGHPVQARHPLQPADPRQFTPGGLVPDRAFSFDRQALAGARARLGPRRAPATQLITRALDVAPPQRIDLAALQDFATDPPRHFLRHTLHLPTFVEEPPATGIPLDLDGLESYAVGNRVLTDLLAGHSLPEALTAEERRGSLPPGRLRDDLLQQVQSVTDQLGRAAGPLLHQPVHQVGIDLDLSGHRLVGTAEPLRGRSVLVMAYSRLSPRAMMAAWVPLLALVTHTGDTAWEAVLVTRAGRGVDRHMLTLPDPGTARTWLTDLVDLAQLSRREPLPAPPRTAHAFAEALRGGERTALMRAREQWEGSGNREQRRQGGAERQDNLAAAHLWPGSDLSDLTQVRPLSDPDWVPSGPSGWFGELARRLWGPVRMCLRAT